jgi:hypothetical protein
MLYNTQIRESASQSRSDGDPWDLEQQTLTAKRLADFKKNLTENLKVVTEKLKQNAVKQNAVKQNAELLHSQETPNLHAKVGGRRREQGGMESGV